MEIETIPLNSLHAHPHNSNVMPDELFAKLVRHVKRTDRYPPVLVRPHANVYQILDGHHRVAALRELGRDAARCVVWEVDDDEALVLLATLNRLQGVDDPRKRGVLLAKLSASRDASAMAALLPDARDRLERLMALAQEAPRPRPASVAHELPCAVHFFLLPDQKRALESKLKAIGGPRETALMSLVTASDPTQEQDDAQTDE